MSEYILKKSNEKGKKWSLSDGEKTVNFGALGYEDYTTHQDSDRKRLYINRHKTNEK